MDTNQIRRAIAALFWGAILCTVLGSAEAITPAQIPLNIGVSAAKPNIMLMIDNSGSMDNNVITSSTASSPSDAPSNFNYQCNTKVSAGAPIPMVVNSTGTPRFCTNSSCSNKTSFSKDKCFNNNSNYTVFYYGTSSSIGPYTGLQLNWYFSNGSFTSGSLAAVATTTNTRIAIAKQAATDLVTSLTPSSGSATVRMGLSDYHYSGGAADGGELLSEIKDLDSAQSSSLLTKISALTPNGNTPLATTLSDIGKYFATGETGNLTLHPSTTKTAASVNTIFSKADGTTSHSITNATGSTSLSSSGPILGYCQKSFVILISDGLPNGDREISPSLRDYTGDCATKSPSLCVSTPDSTITLPGASGVPLTATGTACNSTGNWGNQFCKNGTKAGRIYETKGSDYLDDVAQALYEMDLRPTLDATEKAQNSAQNNNNLVTYAIGLADPSLQQESVLKDAASVGGGKFFFADDSKALAAALDETISDISSQVSSSSSVVANTAKLDSGAAIFQGKFDSADWTGSLSMLPLGISEDTNGNGILDTGEDTNVNGKLDGGAIGTTPTWNAAEHIPAFGSTTTRNILTYNSASTPKGVSFACANLTASQKTALGITTNCLSTDHGVWRLNYLRGDWSHEEINLARTDADTIRSTTATDRIFRNRTHLTKVKPLVGVLPDPWLLGDIVNSNPVYVSNENYGYDKLSGEGATYKDFVTANASRRKMIYVGANDGMLHGFDASASGTDEGKEILAYIPNAVYSGLNALSSPSYTHQYLVDGSPRVADAYFSSDSKWHTLLVGTTGAGGKAVFGLDVTDPSNFGGSNVLWEISDTNSPTAADLTTDTTALRGFANNMGYTLPQASIVKMHDGSWAAIVANGYGSINNLAVLYIINVQTGAIIAAIDTQAGSSTTPNGLSTPIAIDTNDDRIVDSIYAGDLLGNMWKFDVSSSTPSQWKVAYGTAAPAPLFVACSNPSSCDTTRQPITAKPQVSSVGAGQSTGVMVYFGTGKYFETIDNNVANAQTQTFYGIWDNNASVTKSDLQAQAITQIVTTGGLTLRASTNNTVNYLTKKGWYMDLPSVGERVVSTALIRNGRIIFTTLIPIPPAGANICGAGSEATSWLMELDALTGSRLPDTASGAPWDITGDGVINDADLITLSDGTKVAPSGIQIEGGAGTPAVVIDGGREHKYLSIIKDAGLTKLDENIPPKPSGSRQSWRQLQ
jgi:type IV pilus assembly protein PilY1